MKFRIMRYMGNHSVNSYIEVGEVKAKTKELAWNGLVKSGWDVKGLILIPVEGDAE